MAGSMAMTKVIQLEYASAEILSGELFPLFDSKERRRKTRRRRRRKINVTTDLPVKIIPDKRTNTVVILANSHVVNEITDLIKKLDRPISRSKSKIHVYYLENASSEDLASVLSKLPSKRRRRKGRSPALGNNVIISADDATNSLIIAAAPQDYAVLKKIIEKLDITNEQVLIYALIAEVSINMSKEFGIEWRVPELPDNGDVTLYDGTSLPLDSEGMGGIDQLTTNPYSAIPSGLFLDTVKGTMEFGGTEFLNIGALIRAFQANSEINVLSTPHILTMENEEAEIVVGEERPFLLSSQATETGDTTKTFKYKDLGVTLHITPQISQGEIVNLEIFIEIKNFMEVIEVGAINTTKRLAKTTVLVEDGEMIVIGGLIRDDTRKGLSQVPCLDNIPIMGWFFKAFYQGDSKNNLVIFITPHIIETPEDLSRITEDKRSSRKNKKPVEEKGKIKEIHTLVESNGD
ncbi:MAG: secretin N-terminal domain-containing protein [Thermodesulfobacteriota bacterium]|nr:secretin N-terminal domain-containing protein [Thermodesulfobacteriota bacterium]